MRITRRHNIAAAATAAAREPRLHLEQTREPARSNPRETATDDDDGDGDVNELTNGQSNEVANYATASTTVHEQKTNLLHSHGTGRTLPAAAAAAAALATTRVRIDKSDEDFCNNSSTTQAVCR